MTLAALTVSRPWLIVGWTMLHFLWVGGLIGLINALARWATRMARPELRYGVALFGFTALAVAPGVIAFSLLKASPPANTKPLSHPSSILNTITFHDLLILTCLSGRPDSPGSTIAPPIDPVVMSRRLAPEQILIIAARTLPGLWLVGTPATILLLATGLIGTERLRQQCRTLIEGEITEQCRRLAIALGISRPVAVGVSDSIATPILLGVVRPLILLPTSAITGWSTDQIEMALLHELAHVRRLDNLINLAQRIVEACLFFHPAVWWVSGWVRIEREHCCDRVVIAHTGQPRPYAELLAALAEARSPRSQVVVAMAEAPVVDRIRRVLNLEDQSMRLSRGFVVLVVGLLLVPSVLIRSQASSPDQAKEPSPAPAAAKPEPGNRADAARLVSLIQRARQDAESILDLTGRARALAGIAIAQARVGDREAARETFAQAVALANRVSLAHPSFPPQPLFELSMAKIREGLLDEGTELLQSLTENTRKRTKTPNKTPEPLLTPHILLWIADSQAKVGFREEAIDTLRKLLRILQVPEELDYAKIELFEAIVKAQASLGDHEGIRETLRIGRAFYSTTNEAAIRSIAPQALITLQAESGDLSNAFRMLHDPELFRDKDSQLFRFDALLSIVKCIKAGDEKVADPILKEAVQTFEALDAPGPKKDLHPLAQALEMKTIALALARLGRFAEATKFAQTPFGRKAFGLDSNHTKSLRARTIAGIGEEQAKAGDRSGAQQSAQLAVQIAATIPDDTERSRVLETVSDTLAKLGDFSGALRIADSMTLAQRAIAYQGIARYQRAQGDHEGARKTLQIALEPLQKRLDTIESDQRGRVPNDLAKEKEAEGILRQTAWIQSALGDLAEAMKSARRIKSPTTRGRVMLQMAGFKSSVNDLDGAMEIIDQIDSPDDQAKAIQALLATIPKNDTKDQ